MATILIDSREPQNFHELGTVQPLAVGDAWVSTGEAVLVVERKTLSDLCASIADGRLLNQAAAMRQVSPWCYLVITGIPAVASGKLVINGKVTNWRWGSVQGALLSVQELGVIALWIESDAHYGACLNWLAGRDRGEIRIAARREAVLESPAEQIITSFPGIAATRAQALLEHCGTVAFVLQFLTGEGGGHVPGIGEATKNAVRSVLGLPQDQYLSVLTKEEESNE